MLAIDVVGLKVGRSGGFQQAPSLHARYRKVASSDLMSDAENTPLRPVFEALEPVYVIVKALVKLLPVPSTSIPNQQ